jgi:hypothetical protein
MLLKSVTMKEEVRWRDFPVHQQLQNTEAGVAGESVWQASRTVDPAVKQEPFLSLYHSPPMCQPVIF